MFAWPEVCCDIGTYSRMTRLSGGSPLGMNMAFNHGYIILTTRNPECRVHATVGLKQIGSDGARWSYLTPFQSECCPRSRERDISKLRQRCCWNLRLSGSCDRSCRCHHSTGSLHIGWLLRWIFSASKTAARPSARSSRNRLRSYCLFDLRGLNWKDIKLIKRSL